MIYQDKTVYEATLERISYIFDEFENIIVSVSGGKDSTTLATLALNEAKRRGRKIGLFFLDEEVVYASTVKQIEYLMSYAPENTIRLWLQIPFNLTNATSYKEGQLICWDPNKKHLWLRKRDTRNILHKPWSSNKETIRDKNKGFGFYDAIENFERSYNNTAFLVGLRAEESLNRYRAVCKNAGYKNILWSTKKGNNYSFYPLYDWRFHDIWKYIYTNNIKYSKIYDYQYMKRMHYNEMRVSSLVHEKSFKALVELPEFEPETYDKLVKRISGISVAQLYGKNNKMFKMRKLPKGYKSWKDYRDFLISTFPDKNKLPIFLKRFKNHKQNEFVYRQQCRQLFLNDYENNLPVTNQDDPRTEKIKYWKEVL